MSSHLHREYIFTKRILSIAVLIFGLCVGAWQGSAQVIEESQVKAAYLYNFAKFVEWPPETFRDPGVPTVICVVGDEHMSNVLERAVAGKKVNGHPVEARNPNSSAEFKLCNILFIGFSNKERIAETLSGLRGSGVLTVGENDQFISLGGMINLALKRSTIELEIDPEASNAVGLKISSRLLVVAKVIKLRRAEEGER